ncbi:MAG: hypothetical protein ACOC2L_04380 [Candidatus Sumerlaeota bacterium]
MLRARNLLQAYLERNAETFVTRYNINANEVRGGQRFLDVDIIVDLEKLYDDLNSKRFIYEPAFRPVFYLFLSEQYNGQAAGQPLAREIILNELAGREYRYLWTRNFRPNLLSFLMGAAWADNDFKQSELLRLEELIFDVIPELYRSEWNRMLDYLDPSLSDRQKETLINRMWDYSHEAEVIRRIQRYIQLAEPISSAETQEARQALLNSTRTADEQRYIETILRSLLSADGEVSSAEQSLLDSTVSVLADFQPNYLAMESRLPSPNPSADQADNLEAACKQVQRYGVEVFLTGTVETTAKEPQKYYFDQMSFVTTKATLHLVRADTCEILATETAEVSTSDQRVNTARDVAVREAVQRILPGVLAVYEQAWGKMVLVEKNWGPAPYRKNTLLKIMAVGMSDDKVTALTEKLKTLAPPEAEVYTRATFNDVAVFTVAWEGEKEDVRQLMRATSFPGFTIKPVSPDNWLLEVVD